MPERYQVGMTHKKAEGMLGLFGLNDGTPFVNNLLSHVDRCGVPRGMAQAFKENNLHVDIVGDISRLCTPRQPTLLIGSHMTGLERFPVLSVFGDMPRDDIRFISAPYTPVAIFGEKLDLHHENHVLEVVPSSLSRDSRLRVNQFLPVRLLFNESLPTREEGKQITSAGLSDAAHMLEDGYAVNVFPTGDIFQKMEVPWRAGIGEIAKLVSQEKRQKVLVAPYRLGNDFTRSKLLSAIFRKNHHLTQPETHFTLQVGDQVSLLEIIGDQSDSKIITERLQQYYIQSILS